MANLGGRPRKFTDPGEMEKKIIEYFDFCDNRIQQVYSAKEGAVIEVLKPAPYGIEGLSSFLGITRETLNQYSKEEGFSDAIKRARQKVAADVEMRLMDGNNAAGPIFNLKNNFGWKDRTEVTGNDGGPIQFKLTKADENI